MYEDDDMRDQMEAEGRDNEAAQFVDDLKKLADIYHVHQKMTKRETCAHIIKHHRQYRHLFFTERQFEAFVKNNTFSKPLR